MSGPRDCGKAQAHPDALRRTVVPVSLRMVPTVIIREIYTPAHLKLDAVGGCLEAAVPWSTLACPGRSRADQQKGNLAK